MENVSRNTETIGNNKNEILINQKHGTRNNAFDKFISRVNKVEERTGEFKDMSTETLWT